MLGPPFCLWLTSPCTDSWRTSCLERRQLFSETWVQVSQSCKSCTGKTNIRKLCQVPFPFAQVSRLPWALVIVSSLCLCSMSRKTFGWVALIVEQTCCSFFMKSLWNGFLILYPSFFSGWSFAFRMLFLLPYCRQHSFSLLMLLLLLKITGAFLNFNLLIFHSDHSLPSLASPVFTLKGANFPWVPTKHSISNCLKIMFLPLYSGRERQSGMRNRCTRASQSPWDSSCSLCQESHI